MKYEAFETTEIPKHGAFFEPFKEEFKSKLFKHNRIIQTLNEKIKGLNLAGNDLQESQIEQLLTLSHKPEDWLEICFYSEQNPAINHERLWIGGLEKFNTSALYLENLGYFYYQNGKFHKSLEYLAKSHALEKSFFALSLAIAASYSLTQYHLVLDYYAKLSQKDRQKLNDDLLFKVATAAQHEQQFSLALTIFNEVHQKNKAPALPSLQESLFAKFGGSKKMENWVERVNASMNDAENRAKLSLDELITYAAVLMYENKFDKALKHLESIKKERYKDRVSS